MDYLFVLIVFGGLTFLIIKLRKNPLKDIPKEWHKILEERVQFYRGLKPAKKIVFQEQMLVFLNEVYIDAVGFELEEVDRVLVAASAIIPVFNFRNWHYLNLTGVILYPDNFNQQLGFHKDVKDRWIAGMVGTGKFENQMLLSRKALHHGFQNTTDKRNTAIHEFVHLLDKTDGKINGIPENFLGQEYILPWINLMHQKMETINQDKSDIRKYGGTSQTEFFAVVSEYFFERPKLLKRKHPKIYKMLEDCFNPISSSR
jgi:Mlc titration factor MtfA (ptsG expression regulator)